MKIARFLPFTTRLVVGISGVLAASFALAQTYPPAWNSSATYAVGDQIQLNGNVLRNVRATGPSTFKYSYWELWNVRANTNVMVGVGQTFSTLPAAWTYAKNARVSDGAYLHLYISTAKGNLDETFTAPFSLNQGSGALISIIGDNPLKINFTFNASNGFEVDTGRAFGSITGIELTGQNAYTGISATSLGVIGDISNTTVTGFGIGYYAFQGGSIHLENNVSVSTSGTGFAAGAAGAIVIADGLNLNGLGPGSSTCFYTNHNGTIVAENCILGASTGYGHGVWAENGGFIDVNGGNINDCTTACQADLGGRVSVRSGHLGTQHQSNTTDINVFDGGTVDANGAADNNLITQGTNDGSFVWTS
jgi:hypothetical protein